MLGFSIIQSTNETWRKRSSHFLATSFFFFKTPIRSRSPLLTGSRLISLPLASQMFQFAKFEKSKERRLATELGDGFPIGDPWITDGISPWPFAFESVLPSQCPGIHPMHSSLSCTGYTEDQLNLDIKREKPPSDPHVNLSRRKLFFLCLSKIKTFLFYALLLFN